MKLDTLEVSVENHIATVGFNNPPVNSITPQMIDDIAQVFTSLYQDEAIRVVVVFSKLEKAFIAGADINQFLGWDWKTGTAEINKGNAAYRKIAELPQPVICAINGFAFGGGLELALACDIRVIDKNATVGLPETGLGIIPGYGGTQRLPRLVGTGAAKKLILSGAPINAEEAFRIGLAEVLSEPGESFKDAMTLAEKIAGQAPLAIKSGKRAIDMAVNTTLLQGLAYETGQIGELFETLDKSEGAHAFLEKRKPDFSGK